MRCFRLGLTAFYGATALGSARSAPRPLRPDARSSPTTRCSMTRGPSRPVARRGRPRARRASRRSARAPGPCVSPTAAASLCAAAITRWPNRRPRATSASATAPRPAQRPPMAAPTPSRRMPHSARATTRARAASARPTALRLCASGAPKTAAGSCGAESADAAAPDANTDAGDAGDAGDRTRPRAGGAQQRALCDVHHGRVQRREEGVRSRYGVQLVPRVCAWLRATSCVDACGKAHSTGKASATELSTCTLTSCRSACGY